MYNKVRWIGPKFNGKIQKCVFFSHKAVCLVLKKEPFCSQAERVNRIRIQFIRINAV